MFRDNILTTLSAADHSGHDKNFTVNPLCKQLPVDLKQRYHLQSQLKQEGKASNSAGCPVFLTRGMWNNINNMWSNINSTIIIITDRADKTILMQGPIMYRFITIEFMEFVEAIKN